MSIAQQKLERKIKQQPYARIPQRTIDWFKAREKCVITASETKYLLGSFNTQQYMNFIEHKARGETIPQYTNAAMQWGEEKEPEARLVYELITGNKVLETGLWLSEYYPEFGASPDGIIISNHLPEYALLEIKCPYSRQFTGDPGEIPLDWITQITFTRSVIGGEIAPAHLMIYIPKEEKTFIFNIRPSPGLITELLNRAIYTSRKIHQMRDEDHPYADMEYRSNVVKNYKFDPYKSLRRAVKEMDMDIAEIKRIY